MKTKLTIAAAASLALFLSACELRQDADGEEPVAAEEGNTLDPSATPVPSPTPSGSASPVASIIREDAAPDTKTAELPVQPVEMTLPFPDGSDISEAAERRLAGLMKQRAIEEDWPVILGGHTDSGGNDQANLRASRARAEAVAAWLVERGVDDDRIEIIAFGEQNPIAPNAMPDGTANEEGRRKNRRVVIRIAPPEPADGDTDEENASSDQDA
ncbi:OmpA family protein [Aurantiacibacter rhizosphaerae]|uniref:OmpA family protein n=1 Tax=Aurantiacibacter rhizosphaerae TaxID=2691582 RepID=A0A844XGQ9_9SPHN|nr:OmpA family protein [Aurantiacibacter rhizosphaerae]MWV28715.1 OmpA family protein [Aurantiacibacter rhizosphaerae]